MVKQCLDTNWVSSAGPFIGEFEGKFAQLVGARFAVATASGTAALHLGLLAAGIGAGDEVIVPAVTFIATANAVRYVGAEPVFVDVEPAHGQMDVGLVELFLAGQCERTDEGLVNSASGRRVRAILPVHVLGHSPDMERLLALAGEYRLEVIEDAAEALGSRCCAGVPGTLGKLGCFSFNGNKIVTTGAGGMVVTDDEDIAARVRYLSTQAKDDGETFNHSEIGYNYRMANILAAIGLAQIENLAERVAEKREIASIYRAAFSALDGIEELSEPPGTASNMWLYTILVDETAFGICRDELQGKLREAGIDSRPLWQPIHLNKPYRTCQVVGGERAQRLFECALSLPCSVGLGKDDQNRVINVVLSAAWKR